ncbi:MAG TPA: hypothetical protein VJ436_12870, partial [Anaerolineales bacterium]|nr:hypothetical protein [Anaerolineales bacterium]
MPFFEKLKIHKLIWLFGLVGTLLIIVIPLIIFLPRKASAGASPWANIPKRAPHTDHSPLLQGPFQSGPEVTQACLDCHPDAAHQLMQTVHWTWESQPILLEGRSEPVTVGKKNSLNNFCIGIQSNWPSCTSCHAGYGWSDADFDFSNQANVDCLVCHDRSGIYVKSTSGLPAEGVDLLAAAQSVGLPT